MQILFLFWVVCTNELDAQFLLEQWQVTNFKRQVKLDKCQFKLYVTISIGGSDNLQIEKDTIN